MVGVDLLILGASARAAAFSARRASLRPATIDLFADRDLCSAGLALRLPRERYPEGFKTFAQAIPTCPWIYTGGLENAPELVDRIAEQRPLWGNRGDALLAIRNPIKLAKWMRGEGFSCPDVRLSPRGLPRDGSWLVKPIASAGGLGIVPLKPDTPDPTRPSYYQERIAGPCLSAIFIAHQGQGSLRGISRQLVGHPGARFGYAGSVSPWPVSTDAERRIRLLGEAVTRAFDLVGLFGVDLVLRDGIPFPVEFNPRYTASVEVVELALGRSLLAEHCAAFDAGTNHTPATWSPRRHPSVGKAILYAPAACQFPALRGWRLCDRDVMDLPRIGDLPHPNTRFEVGEPVVTLFAGAPSPAGCLKTLLRRRRRWERRLIALDPHLAQRVIK